MTNSTMVLLGLFVGLTLLSFGFKLARKRFAVGYYLNYTWIFFLCFTTVELTSFSMGIWILGLLCFWALKEYFSLIDIRLQDRLGLLVAYLLIPFMIYFIQIDWYGMFIVSIPVYGFLLVALFVTLGGSKREGTVFSIGAIDFGLFLFVYSLGHIGYLMHYSVWMAALLIFFMAVCDGFTWILRKRIKNVPLSYGLQYLLPLPFTITPAWLLSPWTKVPRDHSVILACLVPALVILGQHTIRYVKTDLGVKKRPEPGQGQILDYLRSIFFAAPVVFHYIRYFLT